jgi:hypothetical protein
MRLSELYVMRYLVQSTEAAPHPLCWQESDNGGYWAEVSGIRVEVIEGHGATGGQLFVTFSKGPEQVSIAEPRRAHLFGSKYEDEDQRCLAESMRQLCRLATRQCARRRIHSLEHSEEVAQEIFYRLVFGNGSNGAEE